MILERFLLKVIKTSYCWNWTASKRNTGYGAFKLNGKVVDAHRVSYQIFKGDIINDLHVLHKCDNRTCVNPDHLFLGTHSDNMKDCAKKGRLNSQNLLSLPIKHGTKWAYTNGCRCDKCKILYSLYMKLYRKKKL